jgi:dihydroxy-acid dehydratase
MLLRSKRTEFIPEPLYVYRRGQESTMHNNNAAKNLDMLKIMELLEKDIKPRDIMTEDAFRNALTMDMALGCSTNSMLHLPAIAHECGIDLNLDIANEISAKTPNLCHLAPAGRTYMEELNEAGGIYAVMNEINKLGLLKTDLITCTGKTVAENI